MFDIKVKSLNINKGMLNHDKLLVVKQFCKDDDILLLQETRGYQKETSWKKTLGRGGKFSFYAENSRGVAALAKQSFEVVEHETDREGRLSSILVKERDIKIGCVSFYCPNVNGAHEVQQVYRDTISELKRMLLHLREKTDYVIAAGDLNLILDAALDAEKLEATTYQNLIDDIYDMLGVCNMTDAYRFIYPEERTYTFSPKGSNPHNVFRRLDYCFISEELIPYLENVVHEHCYFSDHKAVTMHLSFQKKVKLRNFWRHNDSLLEIPEYIEHIEKSIREGTGKYLREMGSKCADDSDPRHLWEFLKYFIGKESRSFSKQLALQKNATIKSLKDRLELVENDPVINKEEMISIKASLDALQMEEDKKLIFQARAAYTEHNEKPTSYFMHKIKSDFIESNVIELVKDGRKLSKGECNEEIFRFYKELYRERQNVEPEGELEEVIKALPKLSPDEVGRLGRPITQAEVTTTLFGRMNPGKSPGNDGLTVAFYKKFWNLLKVPYFNSLKASLQIGELTSSQKKSIIRLIQKKGKDPAVLKNWRPISLINVDAKIFSRLITARVEEVIQKLCSTEQLAYVKGRNIMEGNRLINYLTEYMERREGGFIVGFDFEKAFDSIDHKFIRFILANYGFPSEFIHLFETLYNGAESAVMNNGLTTQYFPLGRSCRQGDCLSPYLFILALEPLIRLIKKEEDIKGLCPLGHRIKISVYADDMTGFISSENELKSLIRCINLFGMSSGLKLNVDKTEALHIVSGTQSPITAFNDRALRDISMVQYIKVTGIIFGRSMDKKLIEKANFEGALNKMRNNFNSWNQRDLSILGRVMLAKYHGIALLQYLANNIEVPEWAIKEAKKMIYKFVYKGIDKITRRMASKPIARGGINLPILDDIIAAAAVQWLRKSRVHSDRLWAKFIMSDVGKIGGICGFNALRTTKDNVKDGLYNFSNYLFKCWQHLKNEETLNETTFLSQTIWNNRRFSYRKGRTVYMLQGNLLSKMGYTRVGDFFDQDGRIIEADGLDIPLQIKMEWALATKHIKKYLKENVLEISKGFSETNSHLEIKLLEDQQIYLTSCEFHTELMELRQCVILRLLAKRREDTTPNAKKIANDFKLEAGEFESYYKNIVLQGFATKTRSFFFKLYAGLIYGNSKLFLFGFADSKKCDRCDAPEQDVKHLLFECPEVEKFRQIVYTKLKRNFTRTEEYLGSVNQPYSYILLHMNRFIYQRKFLKLPLNPHEFYGMIRLEKKIEDELASKQRKITKNDFKWSRIISTGILD